VKTDDSVIQGRNTRKKAGKGLRAAMAVGAWVAVTGGGYTGSTGSTWHIAAASSVSPQ